MNIEQLLNRVGDNLSVRRAFGTAYEKDGLLIIPVALVVGGGGGGEGSTPGRASLTDDPLTEAPTGVATSSDSGMQFGSGGGFGGFVLPVGTYVVKGDNVRWVPAVNVTVIILASLSALRLLMRLRTRVRLVHLARDH